MYVIKFIVTPDGLAIAVQAQMEQRDTHMPESVHVKKNWEAEVLMVLNLLSSPAL